MGKITDHFVAESFGRILVIAGRRGEKVHDLIERKLAEEGIRNAVVLSGVATFQKFQYHHVKNADQNPFDEIRTTNGAFEVASIQGVIIDGKAHLHASGQDHYTTIIAHLERDTEILYLAEIVVAELKLDKKVSRIKVEEGVNLFEVEE